MPVWADTPFGILSVILSGILSVILCGILSVILCGILSVILSGGTASQSEAVPQSKDPCTAGSSRVAFGNFHPRDLGPAGGGILKPRTSVRGKFRKSEPSPAGTAPPRHAPSWTRGGHPTSPYSEPSHDLPEADPGQRARHADNRRRSWRSWGTPPGRPIGRIDAENQKGRAFRLAPGLHGQVAQTSCVEKPHANKESIRRNQLFFHSGKLACIQPQPLRHARPIRRIGLVEVLDLQLSFSPSSGKVVAIKVH